MKQSLVFLLFPFALVLTQCVASITFEAEKGTGTLVVDGTLTNFDEPQLIRLSRTVPYGKQEFQPVTGAQVKISTTNNLSELLVEKEPGVYELLQQTVKSEIGQTYELEITLPDGNIYRSLPETMPSVPEIDSLFFDIGVEEFSSDGGSVLAKKLLNVFAQTTINQNDQTDFLRWKVEHVHQFVEPLLVYLPLRSPKTCYIYDKLNPQVISLRDGRNFAPSTSVVTQVSENNLNFTYNWAHAYRVFQYSMTERAFQYWSDLDKISNQVGNLLDTPPAVVRGNMYNVNDAEELVLGYFSASGLSIKALFISKPELAPDYEPPVYCGVEPRVYNEKLNLGCVNCLELENSTTVRPDFWP